ncbi:hypothetical protein M2175_004022 [Bradyrhizobium elkanii]|uniref:hypothetical protein n=1 Tax=Bradyrhizobium TaxID=374 RepID=UPI002168897B|nr:MULTISPECIES: hypothetical protein [Bradyrhizobium]MCS3928991.1 hypothetical protein [Bradyrhizobium elkanii]MCS3969547.1 hypothetical protein [Bradyrhizobium japonicum]
MKLIGVGPMLMHCARLADPLDPLTKALAAITSKRLKTDADHDRIAELEWRGGLWTADGRPCLPPHCLKAVLVEGARRRKKGIIAKAAFLADGPALLDYDGPTDLTELWADERFRHRQMVRVRDALTVRTRPCFPDWSARVSATYLPSMINRAELIEFFKLAGPHGLGDHRPDFGRFRVEEIEVD